VFKFPTELTIDECERFVDGLKLSSNLETLHLPVEASKSLFGGMAAAIQAVNTWARLSESREIALGGNAEGVEKYVDDVLVKPHKFCAAMYARRISVIGSPVDIRSHINEAAKLAVERQGSSQHGQQRGALCWFVFVAPRPPGFDKNFYIQPPGEKPQPRKMAQIENIVRSMVEKSVSVLGATQSLSDDDTFSLSRIFFELFMNTHEHGSRGPSKSNWIKPGQRVLYSNGINLTDRAVENREDERGLSEYLQSQLSAGEQRNRYVEISIIDSGLGYFARWCADSEMDVSDKSLEYEYSIVKKCFGARQTSSDSTTKGLGLPVVMDRLTRLKGFIRIRSGRLSLYRDFISQPFKSDDLCDFSDWMSGRPANEHLTELSPMAGVSVTFLIPLEAK